VSDRALEEAIYVATLFNMMDRLADAFDYDVPSQEGRPRTAFILTKLGYSTASVSG
jgi:hypothetical protein